MKWRMRDKLAEMEKAGLVTLVIPIVGSYYTYSKVDKKP